MFVIGGRGKGVGTSVGFRATRSCKINRKNDIEVPVRRYLSIGLVFCCFGQFEKLSIEFDIYFFPQAFEANASSSGGRQSVNDKELSITVTKSQKKRKSETIQKEIWGTPQLSKRVETEMTI